MNKPMSNTVKVLLALLVVAAAVLEVLEYRKRHSVAPTANPPPEKVQKASPAEKKKTKAAPRKTEKAARDKEVKAQAMAEMPAELRKKLEELDEAVSGDDEAKVAQIAHELLASDNHEARLEAVESMTFAGMAGFADLTQLLLDPDEEIREAARNSWEQRVNEIDETSTKIRLYEAAAKLVVDVDPEYLQELIDSASVELDDHQLLEMLLPLYDLTENAESHKVILEEIDGVTSPDEESKTIEDAKKSIAEWLKDNPPEVEDGDDE